MECDFLALMSAVTSARADLASGSGGAAGVEGEVEVTLRETGHAEVTVAVHARQQRSRREQILCN